LANQEKVLKKKEQLAEGLHLIDYEQLKIENQTLNEKIEERNEELTRLRGKIINQVIMLSHTREKMKFIETQNAKNEKELTELNDKLD
jgi:histone deacetylase 6